MKWQVDEAVRKGRMHLSAIVEQSISVRANTTFIASSGRKRPLLVLVLSNGRLTGLDFTGKRLTEDQIEQSFPTATEQFKAKVGASTLLHDAKEEIR